MSFGERLQELRRSNQLTQEEFAQQLKVSRQAVSKWESSKGYPEIEKIIYICNYYGVSMSDLFQDEAPPPAHSGASEPPSPAGEHTLERKSLKKAFGSFFANLTPYDQKLLGISAVMIPIIVIILFCISLLKGESQMELKLIWLGLLILFAIGEAVTVGLTSIWFAAGALAALLCALLGGPLWLQVTLFIVVSALSLLAIRPVAQKYFNSKVEPTNADRVIGTEAMVTEAIDNLQGTGAVRIGGIVWSARSAAEESIPVGTLVRVLRIEGVKVFVEVVKEEVPCQKI